MKKSRRGDWKKSRGLHSICFKSKIWKSSIFMIFHDFSNFKFVTEIGPEKGDAPTFKKYVTVKSNSFQIHKNVNSEFWRHSTIFALEKHKWKPKLFSPEYFLVNTKLQQLKFMLNDFMGLSKLQKKKTLHRLWLAIALTKIFHCCVFFIHICSGGCSQQD